MITVDFSTGVPGYGTKVIVSIVLLLVCDGVWLKLATGACCSVYPIDEQSREEREHTKRRTIPAVLISAILVSLVTPIFRAEGTGEAASLGALLGFLVFGVFNAVEWALWSKWTLRTCLIDTVYGMAVYAFMLGLQTVSVL